LPPKRLVYAVLGMFMDAIEMLVLTLPVVYPAVIALNGGDGVSAADSAFGIAELRPNNDTVLTESPPMRRAISRRQNVFI